MKWWREPAGTTGGTRADRVRDLVGRIALADQEIEAATAGVPSAGRVPSRPGREPALADQLAVVTYDLRRALRAAAAASTTGVEPVAARALADLLVGAYDVGRQAVDDAAARAALAWLYPDDLTGDVAAPGELLLVLHRSPRGGDGSA